MPTYYVRLARGAHRRCGQMVEARDAEEASRLALERYVEAPTEVISVEGPLTPTGSGGYTWADRWEVK